MSDAKLSDLMKVYHDLERTLTGLRKSAEKHLQRDVPIDLKKLINQLNLSKQRIERKIGNTILLEKQHMGRRLRTVVSTLRKASRDSIDSLRNEA